jgi:hypothetical protein
MASENHRRYDKTDFSHSCSEGRYRLAGIFRAQLFQPPLSPVSRSHLSGGVPASRLSAGLIRPNVRRFRRTSFVIDASSARIDAS